MDAGLGLFGLGLFLLSIALLYAREAFGLATPLLVMSLVSMGYAMSDSPRRREVALGIGVCSLVAAVVSVAASVSWWWALATALFGVAYLVLWAEFRFAFFQHLPQEAGPEHSRHHISARRR